MLAELVGGIHWGAAALAAVAWFILGAAWYMAPPIAAAWQRAGGIEIDEDAGPNPIVFVLTLIAYFVATIVTSALATGVGVTTALDGATLGFVIGIGYALTAAAVTAIYDQKPGPFTHFWINGVFNLIGLTVAGAIIGAFA
jgi:uncharacterized membrane protein